MPKPDSLGDLLIVETLNRMDDKLDRLDGRLDSMDTTLVKQQAILDEHVRRTNLLEGKISADTAAIRESLPKNIEDQIRLARNKFLISVLKVLGVVAGTGAGGVAIKEIATWGLKFLE